MTIEIERPIRAFIAENFLYREDRAELGDTESLLEGGLVDSTGILELVSFLETQFPIRVADEEIVPENLDSVRALATYVQRKLGAAARDAGLAA